MKKDNLGKAGKMLARAAVLLFLGMQIVIDAAVAGMFVVVLS